MKINTLLETIEDYNVREDFLHLERERADHMRDQLKKAFEASDGVENFNFRAKTDAIANQEFFFEYHGVKIFAKVSTTGKSLDVVGIEGQQIPDVTMSQSVGKMMKKLHDLFLKKPEIFKSVWRKS